MKRHQRNQQKVPFTPFVSTLHSSDFTFYCELMDGKKRLELPIHHHPLPFYRTMCVWVMWTYFVFISSLWCPSRSICVTNQLRQKSNNTPITPDAEQTSTLKVAAIAWSKYMVTQRSFVYLHGMIYFNRLVHLDGSRGAHLTLFMRSAIRRHEKVETQTIL